MASSLAKIDIHLIFHVKSTSVKIQEEDLPHAFAYIGGRKITIWSAQPFDEMIDLSDYAPGEIADIFDDRLVVRTVDGSLLINRYDYDGEVKVGDILKTEGD